MDRLQINHTGQHIMRAGNNVLGSPFVTTQLFGSLSGTNKWRGGVLAPNGKIYGIPFNSTQVLEVDPATQTTQLFGSLSGANKWGGGVLAPNGKIYGIPINSTQVLEVDKSTITKQPAIDNLMPDNLSVLATSNYNAYQNKL